MYGDQAAFNFSGWLTTINIGFKHMAVQRATPKRPTSSVGLFHNGNFISNRKDLAEIYSRVTALGELPP